jgi:energy-coupling factor transporter ATP-binding protein EcfA2
MIELHRLGLINWHLLPAMDIDITGHTGVIGENRSGKSTLLDMIQVVMTGNSGRYRHLNASANEGGRKRGQRTVHAYCLGRLSPDEVIRPEGALTYIFLVFGVGNEALTIGLALEASPTESEARTLGQFIARRALSVDDFIDRTDESERPRDWALVRPWLENEANASVYRDEAKKFVADYLKALSTGQRFIDANRFQRAFVNAISFEPIDSATDFVRRYLLDKRDIRIGQLKESIATYQQLRRNIEEAKDRLERLGAMRALTNSYKADLHVYDRDRWIAARARLDWQFMRNRQLKALAARAGAELRDAQRDAAEYDRLKEEAEAERQGIRDAIQAVTQGRRPEFDKDRKIAEQERAEALRELGRLQRAVNQGIHAVRFRRLLPAAGGAVLDLLEQVRTAGGIEQLPAWPADPSRLAALFDDPGIATASLQQRCQAEGEAAIKQMAPLEDKAKDLGRRIADVRRKGVSLERNVEDLASDLEGLGFRPRILCTLLEVVDEDWRNAAEALLGRDREAILVDPEFIEDAIRHLQRNRQRFRGCRIVNTRKIDPRLARPEAGTLAAVLRSDDAIAMAFVIRRIGGVRLAHTIEDLHRPGRAIMRDGTYDDGLTVEMREVAGGRKIGAGAGRAGLALLERELDEVTEALRDAGELARDLRLVRESLLGFSAVEGRGGDLLSLCGQLQSAGECLNRIASDIRDLERNIDPDLRERQTRLDREIKTFEVEARAALQKQTQARIRISEATQTLSSGEGEFGSTFALARAYKQFLGVWHLRITGRQAYRAALEATKNDFRRVADAAETAASEAYQRFGKTESRLFDLYIDYHTTFGLKPDFARTTAKVVNDIEPWVEQNIRRIEEVDLVRYEDQAADAAERTRNFFQHSFAFELRERFDSLSRARDEMNRTLSSHDFHYERYRFTSHPVELYRDIIALVEASRTDTNVFAHLFDSDVTDTNPHAKALRTVQALLLDETRDISEFEDYRKYFTFNLYMKDLQKGREVNLDDRRGTGSGAEQQVPFYVAIGTALAVSYHERAAGDDAKEKGIGLIVLDEAFAKLDGKNLKASMAYYKRLGLQVIVAAPFEKRASLYETMDCFVETIRNGDTIEIDSYAIRERTRRAFAEANPANIGLDKFRQMKAAAERPDAA